MALLCNIEWVFSATYFTLLLISFHLFFLKLSQAFYRQTPVNYYYTGGYSRIQYCRKLFVFLRVLKSHCLLQRTTNTLELFLEGEKAKCLSCKSKSGSFFFFFKKGLLLIIPPIIEFTLLYFNCLFQKI